MSVLKKYNAASGLWQAVGGMGLPQTPVSFSAHKNSVDQTGIATGTETKITFTSIEWSTGSGYDTAQSRFQPSIQGIYLVESNIRFADLNACTIFAHISKNGVSVEQFVANENAGYNSLKLSKLIHFNGSTDYIEIYAGHYAGSAKSVMGSTNDTFFQACLIPDSYDSTKQIVNLTGATSDYLLGVGETAKITYTAATSVPLHVATEEGEYELLVTGDNTASSSSTNDVFFAPNNGSISQVIRQQYQQNSNAPTTLVNINSNITTDTAFIINSALVLKSRIELSTKTKCKSFYSKTVSRLPSGVYQTSHQSQLWKDTTTVWSSLGTITFPFAQSGTVIIKRVA